MAPLPHDPSALVVFRSGDFCKTHLSGLKWVENRRFGPKQTPNESHGLARPIQTIPEAQRQSKNYVFMKNGSRRPPAKLSPEEEDAIASQACRFGSHEPARAMMQPAGSIPAFEAPAL